MSVNSFLPYLYLAGIFHLFIAAANFFLPQRINLKENLARVSLFIRQIFHVHTLFLVLVSLFYASLCLFFPQELLDGSAFSRFISGFMGGYWLLRLMIQIFYYDPSVLKKYQWVHGIFSLIFLYQVLVFVFIALGLVQ